MDDSNPYDYDYNPDINVGENMQEVNLDEQAPKRPPPPPGRPGSMRNLPPPPPKRPGSLRTQAAAPNAPNAEMEDEEPEETQPKTVKPKIPIRERVIFGCMTIGELPVPILNKNFFSEARQNRKMIPIFAGLAELGLLTIGALLNLLGSYFFLVWVVLTKASFIGYMILLVVWAHILLLVLPFLVFFLKYKPFYTAATVEGLSPLKATMYGMFLIAFVVTQILYFAHIVGGTGTGWWLVVYAAIDALQFAGAEYNAGIGYRIFFTCWCAVVPIPFILASVCNIIQFLSMFFSYIKWREARDEERRSALEAAVGEPEEENAI